jgi:hypothetical protein
MAIGKVGSFATVEPALVDFGSMVERNIDKIKAEEQAKAAAKAKKEQADREAAARIKRPENIKKTGIGALDQEFSGQVSGYWSEFSESVRVGDVQGAESSAFKIGEVGALANSILGGMDSFKKRMESDKDINPDAYNQAMSILTSLNKKKAKMSWDENLNGSISVMNEDGTYPEPALMSDFANTIFNVPKNYNELDDIEKVTNTILASTTKSGNYLFNKKITDINSEESKPQVDVLRNQAKSRAGSDASMFVWYNNHKNTDKKLSYKVSGWTENERKEAEEHFFSTFLNAYNKEIEAGSGRPASSGGGSGDKDGPNVSDVLPLSRVTISGSDNNLIAGKDVKGRIYSTNNAQAGFDAGGKKVKSLYAGNDGSFYFSVADPTLAGYGGVSGGTIGIDWIHPDSTNYGEYVNQAVAAFKKLGVTDEKSLASFLRGENQQINTSGY